MREHRPSFTAAFVATCRGLSPLLPERLRLVDDPLGVRFAGEPVKTFASWVRSAGPFARGATALATTPLMLWVLYMQVRTRAIDDALRQAIEDGCRQVVILGAGFDVRSTRLGELLRDVTVFEVDHPATQSKKRRVLTDSHQLSPSRYLEWNFERDPMTDLSSRLASLGHDRTARTFTIWEGVTMYLTADALDATTRAIAQYSAPGSRLAFNYVRRDHGDTFKPFAGALSRLVQTVGEPFRSGFDPTELGAWLGSRGFALRSDEDFSDIGHRLLPSVWSRALRVGRRLAITERTVVAERPTPAV